jgi:5-methylcytosine-specific restriction endonuclease McrA
MEVDILIMINEKLTFQKFGYISKELCKHSHKKVVAICEECKKIRDVEIKQYRKFCHHCTLIGERHPNYKTGYTMIKHYCSCGKDITNRAKHCMSCAQKERMKDPRNTNNWQGGLSYLPYSIEWTPQLRKEIRDRDNHECQICHKSEEDNGQVLTVHHIDYNKENCKEENLISLCFRCHNKTSNNRDYYYSYFTQFLLI